MWEFKEVQPHNLQYGDITRIRYVTYNNGIPYFIEVTGTFADIGPVGLSLHNPTDVESELGTNAQAFSYRFTITSSRILTIWKRVAIEPVPVE